MLIFYPELRTKFLFNFQHIELGLTARKQALVDNIDAWAMWISPPVFVVFNAVYWVSYRHVGAELFKFS